MSGKKTRKGYYTYNDSEVIFEETSPRKGKPVNSL